MSENHAKFLYHGRKPQKPENDGLTKQSFKDECDLNIIMRNVTQGTMVPGSANVPRYGIQEPNFQTQQLALAAAKNHYEELPDSEKVKFDGMGDFLEAMVDPSREYMFENYDETGEFNTELPLEDESPSEMILEAQVSAEKSEPSVAGE